MITLPEIKENSRIGILGGSFDPPHLGHQILALCTLALEDIDQVWVIPCADHPFAKNLSPFKNRLEMCQIAFAFAASHIQVVGIENELPAPSYTVKTLGLIHQMRPDLEISFVMGSDVFLDLPKWKDPEKLASIARLIVFLRNGSENEDLLKIPFPAQIHDQFVLPHVKSTLIRENLHEAKRSQFLDKRVFDYVLRNGLYSENTPR